MVEVEEVVEEEEEEEKEEAAGCLTCAPSPRLVTAGGGDAPLDAPVAAGAAPAPGVRRRGRRGRGAPAPRAGRHRPQGERGAAAGTLGVQLEQELQT